jgi:hypothetical protein
MKKITNKGVLISVFCAAILSLAGTAAIADPSCSNWLWQAGGWYWQQCVNDDGSVHCYHADDDKGSNAYEIDCQS